MRLKHPPKFHAWAGISRRGATQVVIFSGTRYVQILEASLNIPHFRIAEHIPKIKTAKTKCGTSQF